MGDKYAGRLKDGAMDSIQRIDTFSSILAMDEDEFESDEEKVYGDVGHFSDLNSLQEHPAYLGVFIHYVATTYPNPYSIFFWLTTFDVQSYTLKDLKTWIQNVYDIYSHKKLISSLTAEFKETEKLLASMKNKAVNEDELRNAFTKHRVIIQKEIQALLGDFKSKRAIGMITSCDICKLNRLITYEQEMEECKRILVDIYKTNRYNSTTKNDTSLSLVTYAIQHYLLYLGYSITEVNNILQPQVEPNNDKSFTFSKASGAIARTLASGKAKGTIAAQKSVDRSSIFSEQSVLRRPITCEDTTSQGDSKRKSITFSSPDLSARLSRDFSAHQPDTDLDKLCSGKAIIEQQCSTSPTKLSNIMRNERAHLQASSSDVSANRPQKSGNDFESPSRSVTIEKKKRYKSRDGIQTLVSNIEKACGINEKGFFVDVAVSSQDQMTWSEPIPVEILKGILSVEVDRQEAIFEMTATEKSYIRQLTILKKVYMKTFLDDAYITPRHASFLFCRIDEILDMHITFANQLNNATHDSSFVGNIGDVLLQQFTGSVGTYMKKLYSSFCALQRTGMDRLKAKRKSDPRLNDVIKAIESMKECRRLSFNDMHACIYQRVTKYPLLLEQIRKKTPSYNTHEIQLVEHCVKSSKELLQCVNQATSDVLSIISLCKIYKNMVLNSHEGDEQRMKQIHNFLIKSRCVKYGHFECRTTSKPSMEVLVLLYTSFMSLMMKRGERYYPLPTSRDTTRIEYDQVILRTNATDDRTLFLIIYSKEQGSQAEIYPLLTADKQERTAWVDEFELQSSQQHLKKTKPDAPDSLLDVDMDFIFESIACDPSVDLASQLMLSEEKDDALSSAPPTRYSPTKSSADFSYSQSLLKNSMRMNSAASPSDDPS